MSKHTLGPWVANAQNSKSNGFYIRGHDPKTGRSLTWGKGAVAHIPRSSVMPMEANARLIAAAPDLLTVLKEIEESTPYWSEYDVPLGLVDRIRAAIAKAEKP